jgi:UPF0271 protein
VRRVDINADLGEGSGFDGELLEIVSSANIGCGLHAGDPATSFRALRAAAEAGVAVGAHPGHADKARMGREPIALPSDELAALVEYQVGALMAVAELAGTRVVHIKPHGALYHQAADDPEVARVLALSAARWRLPVVGKAGSRLHEACLGRVGFVPEGFIDRRYGEGGRLVPRSHPDALIVDAGEALEQAFRLIKDGALTLCVHGDTPGAVGLARRVRAGLEERGFRILPAQGLSRGDGK